MMRPPEPWLEYTGGDVWEVLRPCLFALDGGVRVIVPAGYLTDLASIPRALWPLLAPFELSTAAPVLHDFLYTWCGVPPASSVEPPTRTFTRAEVDRAFLDVMTADGIGSFRRRAAYLAVRAFGWKAWGAHAREREAAARPA